MGDVITLRPGKPVPASPGCSPGKNKVLLDLAATMRQASALTSGTLASRLEQLACDVQSAGGELDEKRFLDTWWNHVGSIHFLGSPLGWPCSNTLCGARLVWVDEIDSASNADLRRLPGVGVKRLSDIRAVLSAYYWRGDTDTSRELWMVIAQRLRRALEYRYLRERTRVLDGIAFADQVLASEGASLKDPTAPRMIR